MDSVDLWHVLEDKPGALLQAKSGEEALQPDAGFSQD
jgi:hypothetical protein